MNTLNTRALEQMVQDVIDGNENPLKAFGILKGLESKIKNYLGEIEGAAQEEAAKRVEKTFEDSGFIFEKRNGSKRLSFKGIAEVDMAEAHLKSCKDKYKKVLAKFEKEGEQVDEETGEVLPLPEVTYSKDSLIVKNK